MCFWGNEGKASEKKIKSLKAMVFLYSVASICKSSRSYGRGEAKEADLAVQSRDL